MKSIRIEAMQLIADLLSQIFVAVHDSVMPELDDCCAAIAGIQDPRLGFWEKGPACHK